MSALGDSELARDIAVDETEVELIWEKIKIHIVFHPSKMGNGRYCSAAELPTETDE